MPGYVVNLKDLAERNDYFREVLFTAPHSQLVIMSLRPGEEIGMEVHKDNDQFIYFLSGEGHVVLDTDETDIKAGYCILISAGSRHNIVNSDKTEMKLFTLYAPAHHRPETVHKTKEDAEKSERD